MRFKITDHSSGGASHSWGPDPAFTLLYNPSFVPPWLV
jgi:hypothetical protein